MSNNKIGAVRRETFVEKLIRRILETLGGSVDRIFGRGRKLPDALPSTGDLSERLRRLIDKQAQINKEGRKLAPHLIRVKYSWGQTSEEFLTALKRLQNELLVVAIDHINDNRYTTLAPVKIEAKADILTKGMSMAIGFDADTFADAEQVEIPVEIYAKLLPNQPAQNAAQPLEILVNVTANFPGKGERRSKLRFVPQKKASLIVGRIKETDLYLDDESVSKHHASLVMNAEGVLRVADIGSTNGTSLDGARIAYGKGYEIKPESTVGFGDVTTKFEWEIPAPPPEPEVIAETPPEAAKREAQNGAVKIGVSSAAQTAGESGADLQLADDAQNAEETVNDNFNETIENNESGDEKTQTQTLKSDAPTLTEPPSQNTVIVLPPIEKPVVSDFTKSLGGRITVTDSRTTDLPRETFDTNELIQTPATVLNRETPATVINDQSSDSPESAKQ